MGKKKGKKGSGGGSGQVQEGTSGPRGAGGDQRDENPQRQRGQQHGDQGGNRQQQYQSQPHAGQGDGQRREHQQGGHQQHHQGQQGGRGHPQQGQQGGRGRPQQGQQGGQGRGQSQQRQEYGGHPQQYQAQSQSGQGSGPPQQQGQQGGQGRGPWQQQQQGQQGGRGPPQQQGQQGGQGRGPGQQQQQGQQGGRGPPQQQGQQGGQGRGPWQQRQEVSGHPQQYQTQPQQHQAQPQQYQAPPQQYQAPPQSGQGSGLPQQGKQQISPGSQQQKVHGAPTQASSKTGSPTKEVTKPKASSPDLALTKQIEKLSLESKKKIVLGTKGRIINLEVNHFQLNLGKLDTAYHYDFDVKPEKIPKKFYNQIWQSFRAKHFPKNCLAFDGRKNVYSPIILKSPISDEVILQEEDNKKPRSFWVEMKFANDVDLTPLKNIKQNISPQEAIQCVDIVLKSAAAISNISVGRSFFSRPTGGQIFDLGQGMEMYYGFYQSVVRGWKPLLNVDVAHKAFPKEMNFIDLTIDLLSTYRYKLSVDDLRNNLKPNQVGVVEKFLKGLRIVFQIRNQPGSKREYKVNGLGKSARDEYFDSPKGRMSVEQYFATIKNSPLKYPNLPTVWVGSKDKPNKILLPAEFCTVLPEQGIKRKMTENQTSNMIKFAATDTGTRKRKIMDSVRRVGYNNNGSVKEFGFSLNSDFEKLNGRVLSSPDLEYNNKAYVRPDKGVWRTNREQFLIPSQDIEWTIVNTAPFNMQRNMSDLAREIERSARSFGMQIKQPQEPFENLSRCTVDKLKQYFFNRGKNLSLIIVIIPDSGEEYSMVKRAAELDVGCLTQCIKARTMNKLNASTVGNILLKLNSKLNGKNHCLKVTPVVLREPCMIMGADVTHPSPDAESIPSVVAVTASFEPKAFRYNICVRLQPPRMEIIQDLEAITKEQLEYFYKSNNGMKPKKIIFFRDGVSEGQFDQVRYAELVAIRRACKSLEADYEPKITFVVVQKRHHTRMFPLNKQDSHDRNMNVPAGTCIDTVITNPYMQDFYLVSHASIQGVAKPTRYCTLWDDNDFSNDDMQELAYHLCHLFTRCNRSVSYPAPTYYAHLAAARAKVYIESITHLLDLNNLQKEQKRIAIQDKIRKGRPMFFV